MAAISFRRCVPQHFGTKNESVQDRLALFSVFTPFAELRQDDYQIFRYVLSPSYLRRFCVASWQAAICSRKLDFAVAVFWLCGIH